MGGLRDRMHDTSDFAVAARFADQRWGPTGFHCGRCGHDQACHLKCRPREFECNRCHHQQSVTAGTIMESSKAPLYTWVIRASYYERGETPTTTQLQQQAGGSRSTAWRVNHRFMAALSNKGTGEAFSLTAPCRSNPSLGPWAPDLLKTVWQAFRRGETDAATVRIDGDISIGPVVPHPSHPLGQRIAERLVLVHRTVSLRWLTRWVQHLLELWQERRPWLAAMLAQRPLECLAPYG